MNPNDNSVSNHRDAQLAASIVNGIIIIIINSNNYAFGTNSNLQTARWGPAIHIHFIQFHNDLISTQSPAIEWIRKGPFSKNCERAL